MGRRSRRTLVRISSQGSKSQLVASAIPRATLPPSSHAARNEVADEAQRAQPEEQRILKRPQRS